MHYKIKHRVNEGGGIIVTFALLLFLILGFMGLALDLGHLYVVRTELQTALDACALSAAKELDKQPDALTRAINAGIAAGNVNRVDMQSTSWRGKTQIVANEITFYDINHAGGATDATAKFVRCTHTQKDTAIPLVHMAGMLTGANAFAATMNVGAFAEATTTPAQSTCPLPLGIKPKAGAGKPDYGFVKGDWIKLLGKDATNGEMGWYNLDGSTSASETVKEVNGYCGTRTGDTLGTPGVQGTVADDWNTRFGIYKNNNGPAASHPDFTGYVYTKPVGTNAGTWAAGRDAFNDFILKRKSFSNCAASVKLCEDATGLKLNQFQSVASAGANGELQRYGTNRRLVIVPVIDGANKVVDFACMLLLQPIPSPFDDVYLEYRGNAASADSPCTASGLPGGTAGPLVPVLVR
jgi:Flp pilus assembly protein TadG